MENYTETLMKFFLNTQYDEIPNSAIQLAKKHFLDCVGCVLAEASQPRSQIVQRYLSDIGGTGDCRITGTGRKATVDYAAFANGILAHTICFDDSGPSHPSVTIVPGLMALGEKYHFSGRELLAAQVLSYDLFQRLNQVTGEAWDMRVRGWHPSGFFGAVVGAAQASRLLGLDLSTAERAVGIAASLGSGLSQNIGNMGMGLHAGNASRNGITAALLAKEGFTADPQPFEGRFGVLDALAGPGGYAIDLLIENLGKPFKLLDPGITIKPYPNCWAHHKVLQAVLELKQEHHISAEDVEKVFVDLQKGKPTYRYLLPETDLEARYSLGYGIALALLDGELTLKQYSNDRICAADTREMIGRIVDTPAQDLVQQQTVTIVMKNGTRYSKRVLYSKGHPLHDPMTLNEVQEKYRTCAGMLLPPEKVEASMEKILNLEQVDDFAVVMDTLIL
ncbi:MAG: MmgE/PrpD family protein [Lawsonibacter sp.]|nr:MmgE/PrpD family protein [Lawsonibacter sp.]